MASLLNILPPRVLIGAGLTALAAVAVIVLVEAKHNRPIASHVTTSASSMLAEEASR